MDIVEAILESLQLPLEEGINQSGEKAKVRKSKSWKYLTDFIVDAITYP